MCDLTTAREALSMRLNGRTQEHRRLEEAAWDLGIANLASLRYPTRSGNIRYSIEHRGRCRRLKFLFGTQTWTLGLVSTDHAFTSLLVPITYHRRPPIFHIRPLLGPSSTHERTPLEQVLLEGHASDRLRASCRCGCKFYQASSART